jgi:hypothetical protein
MKHVTKTELDIHRRRQAFRLAIAKKAAAVVQTVAAPQPVYVAPQPIPLIVLPPMKKPWFEILGHESKAVQIAKIQKVVAADYSIEIFHLISIRRVSEFVRPRHVAIYLAERMTGATLTEIGRKFGQRDHSTISVAVKKITRLLETDPDLRATVERLKQEIMTP